MLPSLVTQSLLRLRGTIRAGLTWLLPLGVAVEPRQFWLCVGSKDRQERMLARQVRR